MNSHILQEFCNIKIGIKKAQSLVDIVMERMSWKPASVVFVNKEYSERPNGMAGVGFVDYMNRKIYLYKRGQKLSTLCHEMAHLPDMDPNAGKHFKDFKERMYRIVEIVDKEVSNNEA